MGFRQIAAFGRHVGNPTRVCHERTLMNLDPSPESVVRRQLEAYNARDLDALMATYAADARQYEYPATLLADGAAEIRARAEVRFREPNLHARLLHRVVVGNVVVDHEEVARSFPEGPGKLELMAVYEVRAGKIAEARFVFGRKTLDA